tara:strand:+ start:394 stop:606 length:213 start_codon:yes stop_codon:yes gene_type:complete
MLRGLKEKKMDMDFDCLEYYEGEDYNVWEENQVYEDLRLEALEEIGEDYEDDGSWDQIDQEDNCLQDWGY